jgi:serine/threonine protein kinase
MGTPEYMAPEQATDAARADIRADIYSLGCTLYCLLSGRPPFAEQTAMQTILAHLHKEAAPLHVLRSDLPAELSAVVARMISKEPAQRYQIPNDVADALGPFCKPCEISANGPTAPSSAGVVSSAAAVTEEKKRSQHALPERRRRRPPSQQPSSWY